jgi:catechol 2,3-dioxygenase-like lactoylglutathione lyase family enzyme
MITTKGIYHMGIPVNDVERAVKFYTESFGHDDRQAQSRRHGRSLESRRSSLRRFHGGAFPTAKGARKRRVKEDGATHQAFMVSPEDFELAAKKMKDWGVKVYDIPTVERPPDEVFISFDPDRQSAAALRAAKNAVRLVKNSELSASRCRGWMA